MEKSLPKGCKGFVKSGGRHIGEKIIEPNSVMTEIEITTYDGCNTETIRHTIVHSLEMLVSFMGFPGRGAVNTYEKKVHVWKDKHNAEYPSRNDAQGKAEEASGKKRFADAHSHTPTIPVISDTPKTRMRMFPLPGKCITFKPISM